MTSDACLVCGGVWGPSAIVGLRQCRACGFVSADLALSADEHRRLYSTRYFMGDEYRDYVADRAVAERQFRRRLARLLQSVPEPSSKRLFEIGAAYGFFLSVASRSFAHVEGIDISDDASRDARERFGLPVRTGDFLSASPGGPVDVVCLWDTIEHLTRPDLYVARAAALLPPGGVLAVTTGDIGSVVARLRGARWRQIHPPTHLHYFSKATLTRLMHTHGFDVVDSCYEGNYRSVETMAYITLVLRHGSPGVFGALRRMGLLDWCLYVNLFDTLFLVGVRRG